MAVGLLLVGACGNERSDLVQKTIGPEGGIISSHDDVLSLVFQPGSLEREVQIEIFPSDEPPLIFGPAYRVKPDIELQVDVEVGYQRALPNNVDGVSVAAIRLDDYSAEMGHWVALPRLALDEATGLVLASDGELSLYYGMLEEGGGTASVGTSGPTSGPTSNGPTSGPTGDDVTTDPTGGSSNPTDPTDSTNSTDPSATMGVNCGDGSMDPGELCFTATDFSITGGPVDVVLGDFDDNGDLDVATANGDGSYSVRLGDGSGGFEGEINTMVGMGPTALGAGDFDQAMGDDLVIALGGSNQMALLQSQGDGTFMPNLLALTGNNPVDVLLADTSDDGVPDIMLANADAGTVSFFSFMGGLGGEIEYGTMNVASPVGLSFGQYNQNTDMFEDVFAFGGNAFAALPGDGIGISDAPLGGTIGADLRRAVGGDLGGGGAGDAAVADFSQGGVHVMLGDGDAIGFTAQNFYPTGAGAIDVAAADMTGDGDLDLAVANNGDDTVTVLEKTGGSAWDNSASFDVAGGPSGIAAGDLNGDGLADVVVSAESGNAITVLLADP